MLRNYIHNKRKLCKFWGEHTKQCFGIFFFDNAQEPYVVAGIGLSQVHAN